MVIVRHATKIKLGIKNKNSIELGKMARHECKQQVAVIQGGVIYY